MRRRPGPPPEPTALRMVKGNPGRRPLPKNEPEPPPASLEAPGWLDPVAKEFWLEHAPTLKQIGLLKKIDRQVFAGACQWWARYRRADAALKRGMVGKSPSNGRSAVPEVEIARKAFNAAMDVFIRFGITPAERSRVHEGGKGGDGGDGDDTKDRFRAFAQRKNPSA